MRQLFLAVFCMLLYTSVVAQDIKPFTVEGEANYYNFWQGTWYILNDDKPDTTDFAFRVSRSVHGAAWQEEWNMMVDKQKIKAVALRAWDKTNKKWMYTWVSDNGLFQVWEGRKVQNDWYIYKEFDINGDKYLSRQGWIPVEKNKVLRISEKSYDQGITWSLRFKAYYVKFEK